ncbi:hypothetical protein G9A89_007274 [Geosiphon pyriformis]|nr:hypothetical protein G9A89_007274 [Geosiphon pyriformis]
MEGSRSISPSVLDLVTLVDSALQYGELSHVCIATVPFYHYLSLTYEKHLDMDVDAKVMEEMFFYWKYGKDYPSATFEQCDAAYNEYKEFYAKYHQDNPGATTNCYEEYLKTKQGKQ